MSIRSSDIDGVEQVILPPTRDLGDGFTVRRALPSAHRRMVGPFIFFDQMGPAAFRGGEGLDVRPHPHIGLATVTYLLGGEIMHRDSVGSVQAIRPGEVNWMTAGQGIVHSERTGPEQRAADTSLYGLQTWIALPADKEEVAADFAHYKAAAIPTASAEGTTVTVIAGSADGMTSPVMTFSDLVYADIVLADGARYRPGAEHVERALYVVEGAIQVVGQTGGFAAGELVVLKPEAEVVVRAEGPTRLMLIGGEPFPEQRHIYWNFVSSRPDRIEQAKADWRGRRFADVPEEHEFIPLPDEPAPVRYP
ncbi:pirin family protein [Sphingomonas sp. KR1UV-12]|uniref:Pirin family protein n=1 Tax=Sphingomonas aurea TaxID=3063994 RepID=A0ABT9EHM1_9SPHN|nr:pirin family protein [Sphingomonas sp. KR1UV-12]MDP1026475.1 pirin family protein [Sphingomonas sp. KR1UV-12]